jgi:hypothetical protein
MISKAKKAKSAAKRSHNAAVLLGETFEACIPDPLTLRSFDKNELTDNTSLKE